jgi:hypothetical protein
VLVSSTQEESVVACVRLAEGSKITREIRSFETTMSGLLELLAWLAEPVTIAFLPLRSRSTLRSFRLTRRYYSELPFGELLARLERLDAQERSIDGPH